MAARCCPHCPDAIDLVGRLSLPEIAAFLSRATLFVGNDSGLMHLAAAAGAPTLGLFGPTNAAEYAPPAGAPRPYSRHDTADAGSDRGTSACGRDDVAFRDHAVMLPTSGTRPCRRPACRTACRPRPPDRASSDG